MISCEDAQELITALVDKELRGAELESIEAHLAICPDCRTEYAQQKALKDAIVWRSRQIHAPAALGDKILTDGRVFPETSDRGKSWKEYIWPSRFILRPALIAAVVLLLALPAFYFLHQRDPSVSLAAFDIYQMTLEGKLPTIQASSAGEMKKSLSRAAMAVSCLRGMTCPRRGYIPWRGRYAILGTERFLSSFTGALTRRFSATHSLVRKTMCRRTRPCFLIQKEK